MTITDIIENRGIGELLHFTTNRGITGMASSNYVLSRSRLSKDKHLEHVYLYNCESRDGDTAWHDYVNLSITTVNRNLFGISEGRWHRGRDGWWCILSITPQVMEHAGVYFATTNNMYTGVSRNVGAEGLEALFAPQTQRWNGKTITRSEGTTPSQPTCPQAEVLYPGRLPLGFVNAVYVKGNEQCAALESIFELYNAETKVIIAPHLFNQ